MKNAIKKSILLCIYIFISLHIFSQETKVFELQEIVNDTTFLSILARPCIHEEAYLVYQDKELETNKIYYKIHAIMYLKDYDGSAANPIMEIHYIDTIFTLNSNQIELINTYCTAIMNEKFPIELDTKNEIITYGCRTSYAIKIGNIEYFLFGRKELNLIYLLLYNKVTWYAKD